VDHAQLTWQRLLTRSRAMLNHGFIRTDIFRAYTVSGN